MIRLAVIGLGMASRPHALSLLDLRDRVEVVWAASPSSARTDAFEAAYPFPVTNDVEAVMSDPRVDAVLLLTPPSTHLDLARRAFANGKHALVEKPLEVSLDRAKALVAAADAADRRLGVVLQHRFRPGALRLAELLGARALGEIQAARVETPWWRPQAYYDEPGRGSLARDGGGVLMTQAIHSLDLFRALLGPITVEAAQVRTTALHDMETEDLVTALLRLPSGAPATLFATTAQFPGRAERLEVIGIEGVAVLSGAALQVRWLDGAVEEIGAPSTTGSGAGAMDFSHEDHRALIADFCTAVETDGEPAASGREALKTQQLIADLLKQDYRPEVL